MLLANLFDGHMQLFASKPQSSHERNDSRPARIHRQSCGVGDLFATFARR